MRYQLGIVVPIYNSTRSVSELMERLAATLPPLTYHLYLVDDGSRAENRAWLLQNCRAPEVTLTLLQGNSGQQNALLCGLRQALPGCEAVATMDDDLQHPAELLPRMYAALSQGYGLVYAIAQGERKPLYRRLGSLCRDLLFTALLPLPKGMRVGSFRVMNHKTACLAADHPYRFYYLSASALQKPCAVANLAYPAAARPYGAGGYRLGRLCRLYLGIVATYTPLGRALFHPAKGTGYTILESYEGTDTH